MAMMEAFSPPPPNPPLAGGFLPPTSADQLLWQQRLSVGDVKVRRGVTKHGRGGAGKAGREELVVQERW